MVGAADTCVSGVDQHLVRLNLRSVQFLDLELLDASQNQSLHDCSFLTERFCFCFPQTPCAISHTIRFSKKFCKLLFVKFFTKRVALISKASASSRRRQETTIAHKNQKEITSKHNVAQRPSLEQSTYSGVYNGDMKNPPLHRYATRPGLYFTDDGGADAVVRSETADQVWFCVLEPLNQPSAFYADAVRLFNEPDVSFIEQAKTQRICTRRIPSLNLRETLFHMDGPNYGLWYVHLPKAWDGMQYGYRVNGPWDPNHGVSFNPYKLLLDPYAKGIEGKMELDPAPSPTNARSKTARSPVRRSDR